MTTIKKHDIYKVKIKTPEPMTFITGGEETLPAYLKKDEFFKNIANGIIPNQKAQGLYFKTEHYNLGAKVREDRITGNSGSYYPASDDKLWALIYGDRIIAGMLETRTDFNYVNFSYFQNLENLLGCPKNLPK